MSGGRGMGLTIEEDRHLGVVVKGLTQVEVKSPEEIFAIIARSKSTRRTAEVRRTLSSSSPLQSTWALCPLMSRSFDNERTRGSIHQLRRPDLTLGPTKTPTTVFREHLTAPQNDAYFGDLEELTREKYRSKDQVRLDVHTDRSAHVGRGAFEVNCGACFGNQRYV